MTETDRGSTSQTTDPAAPEPAEIARRLTAWRRTGNPDVLWPEVSRARRIAAGAHVAAAIQGALAGRPTRLHDHDPAALGVAAFISGVGPLLGRWIGDGRIAARGPIAQLFARHLALGRARHARLQAVTADVVALLRDAGVEPVLLKGAHLGLHYPEPGARMQGDVDLLVAAGGRARLEDRLRAAGWRHKPDVWDELRTTWIPPDAPTLPVRLDRTGPEDPWSLDLHWTLDRARGATIARLGDAETVARTTIDVGGERQTVLGPPDLLVFVACHASLGFDDLQLCRLVDLVLLTRDAPDHWHEALEAVAARGCTDLLFPSAALAARLAPEAVPRRVLETLRRAAPRRMRAAVDAADPGTLLHRDARTLRQKLMWSRHPGETLVTLTALLARGNLRTWRRRARLLAEWLGGREERSD